MDDLCNNLQIEYEELMGLVEKNLPSIWTNITAETDFSSLKPNETDFNKLGKFFLIMLSKIIKIVVF
jgi:hypothetical protein